jgi:hypothetical protein
MANLPEGSSLRRSAQGFQDVVAARGFSHSEGASFVCTQSRNSSDQTFLKQSRVPKRFQQLSTLHLRAMKCDPLLVAQVRRVLGSDGKKQ